MRLKDTGLTAAELKAQVKKYMIETYERMDFVADYAEGVYMYDENGEAYLDFYAGIAVNCLGNCNPKVVKAIQDQAATIMQTFNYPYTVPQAVLSKEICETIGMDKVLYQNSGAEANEAMIKMARKYGVEKYGPHKYNIVTDGMTDGMRWPPPTPLQRLSPSRRSSRRSYPSGSSCKCGVGAFCC